MRLLQAASPLGSPTLNRHHPTHLKLSVKSDYAARAVLSLARRHHRNMPTRVEEIARENGLPANYLVQDPSSSSSPDSDRPQHPRQGRRVPTVPPPSEISIADILRCVHGPLFDSPALADPKCPAELRASWHQLQAAVKPRPAASTSSRCSTLPATANGCSTSEANGRQPPFGGAARGFKSKACPASELDPDVPGNATDPWSPCSRMGP